MPKYSFLYDYAEGCHPDILAALAETNLVQQTAYGEDEYCERARKLIGAHLGGNKSDIYFVASGTLANIIMMASALRSHEAVICADTGHINTHETGAIEAVGHKLISVPSPDGKLTPEQVQKTVEDNTFAPHMAKPRLVYISNATETGRRYTKDELTALSKLCRANDLLLFVDGARLGAAIAASEDVTLKDLAELTDLFWIGGTKAGALIGEAIVINNEALKQDFWFHIKQRGGLLAKGRLLGLQFQTLFANDLFFKLSRKANARAAKISKAVLDAGYTLADDTETNQVFPVLPNALVTELDQHFQFYNWRPAPDDHSVLRLCTSWATDDEQIEKLIGMLRV